MPEIAKDDEIDMLCPVCESGYMRNYGVSYLTEPVSYPHWCNNILCQNREMYLVRYPYGASKDRG